jgi:hypothetical protein
MKAGFAMIARRQLPGKKSSWLFFLTMTVLSGCSVLYTAPAFTRIILSGLSIGESTLAINRVNRYAVEDLIQAPAAVGIFS